MPTDLVIQRRSGSLVGVVGAPDAYPFAGLDLSTAEIRVVRVDGAELRQPLAST